MENIEKMLSPTQLADILGTSLPWVYKLVREKRIPFYHVERCVRFSPSEVREWLEERKNKANPMPRRLKKSCDHLTSAQESEGK